MNCPVHRRRLVFVRRQVIYRWFFCAGNGCQNREWRAQDGRPGVIAFREALGPALGRPKG